jgi:hypothetical protein
VSLRKIDIGQPTFFGNCESRQCGCVFAESATPPNSPRRSSSGLLLRNLERLSVDLAGAPRSLRDPHLSLVYKRLSERTKRELAATIKLPIRNVEFNVIKAVRCPFPTKTRADVEAWRVIATKKLAEKT